MRELRRGISGEMDAEKVRHRFLPAAVHPASLCLRWGGPDPASAFTNGTLNGGAFCLLSA